MSNSKNVVYYFCMDSEKDPAACHIFNRLQAIADLEAVGTEVDGYPVLTTTDGAGNHFHVVRTAEVVSHDYPRYLPMMNQHFASCHLAGVVNWHEGSNAPDRIFCVHTTGDVPSGIYGAADAKLTGAMLRAIEAQRQRAGLDDFTTTTEATHWSGITFDLAPDLLAEYPVPTIDIEIGSSPSSWADERAATVLAHGLLTFPEHVREDTRILLYVGGVHFEGSVRNAVINQGNPVFDPAHILPNHWVVAGGYTGPDGLEKLRKCVRTITGGVQEVVFHGSLKSGYKAAVREMSEELQLTAISHKALRSSLMSTVA